MFFSVSENFNFLGCFRGIKGQETVHNNKKFALSCSIYQEPYIIWLLFMVHLFKMIRSPGIFSMFLKILIFWLLTVQKTVQNDKKFCLLHSISQEPNIIWLWFMVHMCKMIISVIFFFFHFFKILIFWVC